MPYFLEPARIDWGDDNVPVSSAYGDVYYSREHGLDETRHVFLHNNHLEQRWRTLRQPYFAIAETGFGTGLNFLAAWQLWRETQATAPQPKTLQFVSVEKHPIARQDLEKALQQWPELAPYSRQLIAQYPPLIRGHHRLQFDHGSVILDLVFDDAQAGFSELLASSHPAFLRSGATVDAWFLDGFAPGTNPGMWTEALFDQVAALSHSGTTFATFTAAGFVRRALMARGFAAEKVPGFGRKREMLRGELADDSQPLAPGKSPDNAAWHVSPKTTDRPERVAVIGAGLAGAHTAYALARRGITVDVYEQADSVAAGASGNPQGILYTKLSHQAGLLNRFALSSFLHALRFYRQYGDALPGELCGVFQLLNDDKWQQLKTVFGQHQTWCRFPDAAEASTLTGTPLRQPGVFYPGAGWLRPVELCRQLLNCPGVTLHLNTRIDSLNQQAGGWHLETSQGGKSATSVVIAASNEARKLTQCAHLPLKPVRGQLSYFDASAIRPTPKTVICHEGYLAPPVDDTLVIGASYNTRSESLAIDPREHDTNLEKLRAAISELKIGGSPSGGRAALRCTSPDYLPVVGPAPDAHTQRQRFAALGSNARRRIDESPACYVNLYLNVAHGSRGLTSTPLAAEILASQICGEVPPLPRELLRALSPSRFLIRDIIRGITKP